MKLNKSMIIIPILIIVLAVSVWLLCSSMNKSQAEMRQARMQQTEMQQTEMQQDITAETLPPLRSDEQMLDFIVSQAKVIFGASKISFHKHDDSPVDKVDVWKLAIFESNVIRIYRCHDHEARERLGEYFFKRESTKDRGTPITQVSYGNLVVEYYHDKTMIINFMQSVMIDTRKGMVLAERWQEWLAGKGVEMKIADEGFGFINNSLSGWVYDVYQTLPLLVDGCKVELICCTDAASAQRILKRLEYMYSIMDIIEGKEYYGGVPYGRFLIMSTGGGDKIELLVNEFWSKQQL